jgi:helicase required for RNAi-mediated heterochromatin assembly 1
MLTWHSSGLTENQLAEIPGPPQKNLGLPMEEEEIQFEQPEGLLAEIAAEAGFDSSEENTKDALIGTWIPFGRRRTGRHHGVVNDRRVKKLLKENDHLFSIPESSRGEVYRFWEKKLNEEIALKLRAHLRYYQETVRNYQVAKVSRIQQRISFLDLHTDGSLKWFCNTKLIQHLKTKVIGCTTTGLSKYRGLISALQPKALLIEEAAETLEGYVVAGMIDSLEHLVLVGDHKQLQANCTMGYLENEPYNMKVSLFERLIHNNFPYIMLNKQRRMIPDIRKLLCVEPAPFYRNLQDHESVRDRIHNRPPVPGMGGLDTYFFHHNWPEATGSNLSKYNRDEAEMVAGFYHYLVFNGIPEKKITVLTVSSLIELVLNTGADFCSSSTTDNARRF